jgi:hypothetical protein
MWFCADVRCLARQVFHESGPPLWRGERVRKESTVDSCFRYEEVDHMVGEILAILAVVALCVLFVTEVGSPYHR